MLKNNFKALLALALTLSSSTALAVPNAVPYNGYLTDTEGLPYDGTVSVEASLFAQSEGGDALWSFNFKGVAVDNGRFSIVLGGDGSEPLSAELVAGDGLWVEFAVNGDLLQPRQEVLSVPYALAAEQAATCDQCGDAGAVGGLSPDDLATQASVVNLVGECIDEGELTTTLEGYCAGPCYGDDQVEVWLTENGYLPGPYADSDAILAVLDAAGYVSGPHFSGKYADLTGAPPDVSGQVAENSAALAAQSGQFGSIEARLWCLENCNAAALMDCKSRVCDGDAQTCTEGDALADGTLCKAQFGAGSCLDGLCVAAGSVACGETVCPDLPGNYVVECNAKGFCEYANVLDGDWRRHDVWIFVPPGTFPMGSPGMEEGHTAAEEPVHDVTFAEGFFIMKYEATVAQYEQCLSDGACNTLKPSYTSGSSYWKWGRNSSSNGRSDHPQNVLGHADALDVCSWIGADGGLPTEAQWEYAAKGPVHTKWVWGYDPPPTCDAAFAVFDEDGDFDTPWGCQECGSPTYCGTLPVGTMPSGRAWCGAMDMAGNVEEWVADKGPGSGGYEGAPEDGSAWMEANTTMYVVRGGSFRHHSLALRPAARSGDNPYTTVNGKPYALPTRGVRCVRPLP